MDALHVDKRDVACVLAVEALRRGKRQCWVPLPAWWRDWSP